MEDFEFNCSTPYIEVTVFCILFLHFVPFLVFFFLAYPFLVYFTCSTIWLVFDWLIHIYSLLTKKWRWCFYFGQIFLTWLRSWRYSKLSGWRFDFFPRKFAAWSKPPSRDKHRKASYPRTQQRDQGGGWIQIMQLGSSWKRQLYPLSHVADNKLNVMRYTGSHNDW